MPNKSYRNAIKEAIELEMRRDPSVIVVGEDVRGGHGGKNTDDNKLEGFGGVLGVTKGLWTEFGSERVIDTPITESAIIGMAAGAAATGLRPVADLMFMDFYGVCYDMLYNQAAKFRYMFGGKAKAPLVVRGMIGAGFSAAAQHSQSPYNVFASVPGLKVVVPSNPADAKGLLKSAIRDENPVIFMESEQMYGYKGMVPSEEYLIPIGKADIVTAGTDVTIVSFGKMMLRCHDAVAELAKEGISVELIDLRTVRPIDYNTVIESVKKTNRLVIVEEAWPLASISSEISHMVQRRAFDYLDAPIHRVTTQDTPLPYAPTFVEAFLPTVKKIMDATKSVLYRA